MLTDIQKVAFASSIVSMIMAALTMNFLVCLVVYRNKALRQQISSVFIVNLAVIDFLTGLLAMPFSLGSVIANCWPFGTFTCQLTAFWNLVLSLSAVLTLGMISWDRYTAVIRPLHYRAKMTVQRATLMILYVWFQATVFSIVPTATGWFEFNSLYFFCTFPSDLKDRSFIAFTVCLYVCNIGIALIAMIITYYRIFNVAKLHSRRIGHAVIRAVNFGLVLNGNNVSQETSRQREARTARKICFVIGAFLCCNAPYTIVRLLELSKGAPIGISLTATIAFKWISFLKSAIHPFVYGLLQRRFRHALLDLLNGRRNRISSIQVTRMQSQLVVRTQSTEEQPAVETDRPQILAGSCYQQGNFQDLG